MADKRHAVDWKFIISNPDPKAVIAALSEELGRGNFHDTRTSNGKSALHYAAKFNNLEAARLLLKHGADPNAATSHDSSRPGKLKANWRPLHYAVRADSRGMVRLLIQHGADPRLASAQNETPAEIAWTERRESAFWGLVEMRVLYRDENEKPIGRRELPETLNVVPSWATQISLAPLQHLIGLQNYLKRLLLRCLSLEEECLMGRTLCEMCILDKLSLDIEWNLDDFFCDGMSFNYGFLPRCRLCGQNLLKLPRFMSLAQAMIIPGPRKHKAEEDLKCLVSYLMHSGPSHPSSEASFCLPAYWFLRCLNSHSECRPSVGEVPPLPSRIINVPSEDGSSKIFLHETGPGDRGLYCTLSYRWPRESVTTTSKNLLLFKNGIDVTKLPKTIKDAIAITRKLGIRYIWIDALCILQDSSLDWSNEAAKMHDIYKNSVLTIAAATSTDDSPGILQSRTELIGGTGDIIDARGWVLQEQLLSPRILTYRGGISSWQCFQHKASEKWPAGIPRCLDLAYAEEDSHDFKKILAGIALPRAQANEADWAYWLWRRTISRYTIRKLTVESDRLAAIQGIATVFASRFNDHLVAGIWKSRLAEHLAWWVPLPRNFLLDSDFIGSGGLLEYSGVQSLKEMWPNESTKRRPQSFKAPSWSWASVLGPVTYHDPSPHRENYFSSYRQCMGNFKPRVQIIDVEVHENNQSRSAYGRLTLQGSLSRVYTEVSGNGPFQETGRLHVPESYRRNELNGFLMHGRSSATSEYWWPDDPWRFERRYLAAGASISRQTWLERNFQQERVIYCLHLGNGGFTYGWNWEYQYCLCLVPTGKNDNEFERVGLCAFSPGHDIGSSDTFDDKSHVGQRRWDFPSVQTVTIV